MKFLKALSNLALKTKTVSTDQVIDNRLHTGITKRACSRLKHNLTVF